MLQCKNEILFEDASGPDNGPQIECVLAGDAGNDNLELSVRLANALDEAFAALIDAGPGLDTCSVTPGLPVCIINCEDWRSSDR